MPAVLAIAAHPDDIEFMMSGTLLALISRGWEAHYFNLASGNGGSLEMDSATTARTRLGEAKEAAAVLGAAFYPPVGNDMEITYRVELLRRVTAVVREVNPAIVLTHSPQDYMEDHMETSRLAVSASFAKSVPNFASDPDRPGAPGDIAVYHSMTHSLAGPMREAIIPDLYVDISDFQAQQWNALACHRSQQNWLSASQGMNSYLRSMVEITREMGRRSGRFAHAEGWRQHASPGFSLSDQNPLQDALEGLVQLHEG